MLKKTTLFLHGGFPKAEVNQGAITKCVVDAILDRPNNLKRLMLNKISYKMGVDSSRLFTALNKIQILELDSYTEPDVNMLFKKMTQEDTSVTSLSLFHNLVLSELEPDYLFNVYVFDKLKEFGVRACGANHPPHILHREPQMVKTLCEKIAAGSNLKILRLENFHDLSQVSRSTLSRMVTQVEKLELSSQRRSPAFSADDITTIVRAIANNGNSNLKKLIINTDMGSVDSSLVVQMATEVEDLELHFEVREDLSVLVLINGSRVREDQLRAIFGAIAIGQFRSRLTRPVGPGKLRRMKLFGCSYLHTLDAHILAGAVNNLESFELDVHSDLTVQQAWCILTEAKMTTTLKRLRICVNNYASYLDPLVAEAEKIIPHLYIEKIKKIRF